MTKLYHEPVMLSECITALNIYPEGVYVDATFGGGGHSKAILERIKGGKLIAFDQDRDAKGEAKKIGDRSFIFCQANFRYLQKYLKLHEITRVDGILADLGVSSHQIDDPDRGFSTRFDGPLDMRMDHQSKLCAADILNQYSVEDLQNILGEFGEVANARTLAKAIVKGREEEKFQFNTELIKILLPLAPRGKEFKYYAQVFQALRIEVNKEMEALELFLKQCEKVLVKGGRLVVMSYHSLEDRMVKNYMQKGKVFGPLEKDFYGNPLRPFLPMVRKPITPQQKELVKNSRARSAKLRVAERI